MMKCVIVDNHNGVFRLEGSKQSNKASEGPEDQYVVGNVYCLNAVCQWRFHSSESLSLLHKNKKTVT
jgi:hypothetical protein